MLDIERIRPEALEIVRDLCDNYGFTNVLLGNVPFYDFTSDCLCGLRDLYEIHHGCTRYCIHKYDADYVIKVQYHNGSIDDEFNYGANELKVWREAVAAGLSDFFAPVDYLFNYDGFEFYAMEYIDMDEDNNSSHIYDTMVGAYSFSHPEATEEDCMEWFESNSRFENQPQILRYAANDDVWGADNADAVAALLNRLNVNDIHIANVGYNGDMFVIADYAGYRRNI